MRRVGAGAVLLGGLLVVATAAPLLAPYDPDERSGTPFARPSADHLLGTNDVGHDLLSELIFGARVSLAVGVLAAVAATLIGASVGVLAGYARGRLDAVLMRAVDVVLALPVLPLTIVVGVFAGPGLRTQIAVIAAVIWAGIARELRAQVLSLRERDHIQALRAMGAPARHVLPRHVVPALAPVVVPQFVLATKTAIVLEASLAFLGLGDVTTKSWGTMLSIAYSRSAFLTDAWMWWVIPPGLAIAVTVLAFALLGYGLEERARPALRDRRPRHDRRRAPAPAPAPLSTEPGAPLRIEGLRIGYGPEPVIAVHGLDLSVARGEAVGLVGESGSGKSSVAAATCGLLPGAARILGGRVLVDGHDVAALPAEGLRALRGARIALIPQEAMSALNPVHTVEAQLVEALRAHPRPDPSDASAVPRRLGRAAARARAAELLALVGLDPARGGDHPHQLSGGMRQRVVIAIAIASDPAVVVADEPTSGLDVLVQNEILDLLDDLRRRLGLALLVISHDLPVVERLADRIGVLHAGRLVEFAPAERLLRAPEHPYTRTLLGALARARPARARAAPAAGDAPLLRVEGLNVTFGQGPHRVRAVAGVHLEVAAGETVGLVGGSGAGKSTVARAIAGLVAADAGSVVLDGVDLTRLGARAARAARRDVHLVFQDPYASLPPTLTVGAIVAEPLVIHRVPGSAQRVARVREALGAVRLDPERYADRYPHQLSGGERQRVAIARALVTRPRLILADEPTQMLDASLRVGIVELLDELRADRSAAGRGPAVLHITHDLALARVCCDRIVVMHDGHIVEQGPTGAVFSAPQHPYTAALVAAGTYTSVPTSPR